MRMHTPVLVVALFAPLLLSLPLSPPLPAQGTSRTLVKPEVEYREPFSQLTAVRELRDGRVVVVDFREKLVQLIDLKAQKSTKIGREGSGPGEYGLPMGLVGLPGDTSIIFDPMNTRYLTILPDGRTGATFRIEMAPRSGTGPAVGGPTVQTITAPRATDSQGRLYFEGPPLTMGPQGPVPSDSAAVMRYDRKTKRLDTLAFLQLPKNSATVQSISSGGQQNVNIRIGGPSPFPSRDGWTVLPDGSIAVARVKDYHVDIIAPNRTVTRGPAVPFSPVKIGDAEKQEYRDSRTSSNTVAIAMTNENGKVSTSAMAPPKAADPAEWPSVKPPFTATMVASPTGEIWVPRSRSAKDLAPRYDVFSKDGKLTGTVVFPPRTRVAALGSGGAIYTVRTDDDDLQYLQRFRR